MVLVRLTLIAIFATLWLGIADAQLLNPGPLHQVHTELSGDDNCSKCHASGKKVSASLCLNCHTDLRSRVQQGKGLHGATYKGKECESCHIEHIGKTSRLVRWPNKRKEDFDHKLTGWPLKAKHAETTCAKCHSKKKNFRGSSTYLGLKRECASCHEDPHAKRFGSNCLDCHVETEWKIKDMKSFKHELARFPLKGKHVAVECAKCHGTPARWKGIAFSDCISCHEDAHKGGMGKAACKTCHVETSWDTVDQFRGKHPGVSLRNGHRKVACSKCHDQGNMKSPKKGSSCASCHSPIHLAKFGRNCKSCHSSIQWTGIPEKIGKASHNKTRFSLLGEHKDTKCIACHPKSTPAPKRFKNLSFDRCLSCHADTHQGAFASRDQGECAQCHSVEGFWPTSFGGEEHATASFALQGRHLSTPCSACHKGKRPRVDFKIKEQTCASCHANPHGEQFASELKTGGCATCHNVGGWSRPNIDHSSWPLSGAHASAECDACHSVSEEDRKRGSGATYRGVPRQCQGCHEDAHAGQFRLSKPKRPCEDCHNTLGFALKKFNHEEQAGYALTGGHKTLKCAKCHTAERLKNGKEITRYRLGYRECKDCHANPHRSK